MAFGVERPLRDLKIGENYYANDLSGDLS